MAQQGSAAGWRAVLRVCLLRVAVAAGAHIGRGFCLGDCNECFALLEALPRAPQAASAHHLDAGQAGPEELMAFLDAPEVCRVEKLFPVSLDREFWSLSSLQGGAAQLRHGGAAGAVRAATSACEAVRGAAVDLYSRALGLASACGAGGGRGCGREAVLEVAQAVAGRWQGKFGGPRALQEHSEVGGFVAPLHNETPGVLAEYLGRVRNALASPADAALPITKATAAPRAELQAYKELTALALDVSRHARMMMEHVRLAWGIKDLAIELSSVYPDLPEGFPPVAFNTQTYGRHVDVLERLLLELQAEAGPNAPPLRFAEMGVACGAIGYHLLLRFPSMQYHGADPTIFKEVHEGYKRFGPRAQLHAMKSEELHEMLPPEEQFDLVFIDGPHTYANVRKDIQMWQPRVRPGGILAGHDFSGVHPPLLWAVLEARMHNLGGPINVGVDGVWWWRVE